MCYLHLGTGKTGTTAIQFALASEQDHLAAHDVDYPDISRNHRAVLAGVPVAGNGAAVYKKLKEEDFVGAFQLLAENARSERDMVISCEGFWQLPMQTLAKLSSALRDIGFAVKALVCFRPQAQFLESSYLQQVKAGRLDWRTGLGEYAQAAITRNSFDRNWSWLKVADKLAGAFGSEHLTVFWYPNQIRRGHAAIVEDFFRWIGVPPRDGKTGGGVVNPSPNPEALLVLRLMNAAGVGSKAFADAFLAEAQRADLLDRRPMLAKSLAEKVDALTRSDNEAMLARYAPGELTAMAAGPQEVTAAAPPVRQTTLADMLECAARVLRQA
jgi:hypothetical protein